MKKQPTVLVGWVRPRPQAGLDFSATFMGGPLGLVAGSRLSRNVWASG